MKNRDLGKGANLLLSLGVFGLWMLIWYAVYRRVGQDLLVASPIVVAARLWELVRTGSFWAIVFRSLWDIFLGFILGTAVGILVGILTAFSPFLHRFFHLPMGIIKSTPMASFIILALVWLSSDRLAVFISFLMVLPLMWSSVHEGLRSADPKLLEMGKVFQLSRGTVARFIYLPSATPFFLSGLRVALGYAWKAGISGEVLAISRNTIGGQLYNSKVYLLTVDLFAWTVVVIVLSLLLEKGVLALAKLLARSARLQTAPLETEEVAGP